MRETAKRWRAWVSPFTATLVLVRLLGALVTNVSDCDETYNYWEPLHHLLHGGGMQTWEYSPDYALRSYLYLLLHAGPAALAAAATGRRIVGFYAVRVALGLASAWAETSLVRAARISYGEGVSAWTAWFLLTSAGMFHASVSFLPSAFAMYCVALCLAWWSPGAASPRAAIAAIAVAAILGWPFAAVAGAPVALHLLLSPACGPRVFLQSALAWGVALTLAVSAADSLAYGRFACSPFNLLLYNARPTGDGSQLYGTEPAGFYARNLLLNFNAAFPLACLGPLAALTLGPQTGAVPRGSLAQLRCASLVFPLWLAFFTAVPHKEERFMFVVYPSLCLNAAVAAHASLGAVTAVLRRMSPRRAAAARLAVTVLLAVGTAAVSASRAAAIVHYYRAPVRIFAAVSHMDHYAALPPSPRALSRAEEPGTRCGAPRRLCLGSEWYRFPASFFLPPGGVCLSFVRSDFRGQLPQPFHPVHGTRAATPAMNAVNREEPSRYVHLEECDLFVGAEGGDAPRDGDGWTTVLEEPMLDVDASPTLTRAFWIPRLSARRNTYTVMALFARPTDVKA